ncbi:amino acid ABC transporter substrate-binding protein [Swaminathania salitolerans LMG 21291]|nr:amino acid ABC transporter substrate-binding protein [Swaminathania salitolerans LMG 21291]
MLLPLTGRFAKLGQQMANAAHIAVPDGHGVVLDIRDTDAPGQTAEGVARSALDSGDRVILGPLTAAQTGAVATVTQPAAIPEFAYTSDQAQARPGLWVMGVTVEQQVQRLVEAAVAEGRTSFAAFLPESPLGHALADALTRTCASRGLATPRIAFHERDPAAIAAALKTFADLDARETLARQKKAEQAGSVGAANDPASGGAARGAATGQPDAVNPLGLDAEPASPSAASPSAPSSSATSSTVPSAGASSASASSSAAAPEGASRQDPVFPPPSFDVLLLGDTGLQLAAVIDGMKQAHIDPRQTRILGPGLWAAFVAKLGALQGGWFAAPDPSSRRDFAQRYRSRYGYTPSVLANVAYDTATMAAVLSQTPDGFSRQSLLRPDGFAGADGTFVLRQDGTVARGLAVFEILPHGGMKMSSSAPRRLTQ